MIQIIPRENLRQKEYLDNCLEEVKTITFFFEKGVINSEGIFRIGNTVLMPIIGFYPIYGLLDNALIEDDNAEESLKILKAKMRYYTAYLYENYPSGVKFSLYPTTPKIESYYLEQAYLAMKVGPYDWNTNYKYASLVTND